MPKKSRFPIIRSAWPRVIDYRTTRLGSIMVDGRWRGNGRREYFHDPTEAKARADQLAIERQNHGTALLNFPAEDRVMAVESRELLRPWGKTIRDATQHYLAHLQAEASNGNSPLIRDCVTQYLVTRTADAHRGDLAKRSLDEIRSRMTQFASVFSDVRVTALSDDQLKSYLDSFPVSALTRNNIRRVLSGFFAFCITKKWITKNPAAAIRIRVRRVEIVVLTVEEAERLLRGAEASKFADVLVPYVALCLFAGLRPFEARQLEWSNIDFETNHLHVLAHTSKKRESRYVHMEPALIEWLRPYSRTNRKRICGPNFRKQWESLIRGAGYSDHRPWPQDCMRHTAASMLLVIKQNRALVAEELGTSVDILRKHYRKPIARHAALRYWELRPSTKAAPTTEPEALS